MTDAKVTLTAEQSAAVQTAKRAERDRGRKSVAMSRATLWAALSWHRAVEAMGSQAAAADAAGVSQPTVSRRLAEYKGAAAQDPDGTFSQASKATDIPDALVEAIAAGLDRVRTARREQDAERKRGARPDGNGSGSGRAAGSEPSDGAQVPTATLEPLTFGLATDAIRAATRSLGMVSTGVRAGGVKRPTPAQVRDFRAAYSALVKAAEALDAEAVTEPAATREPVAV